jgi:hypothetical protein
MPKTSVGHGVSLQQNAQDVLNTAMGNGVFISHTNVDSFSPHHIWLNNSKEHVTTMTCQMLRSVQHTLKHPVGNVSCNSQVQSPLQLQHSHSAHTCCTTLGKCLTRLTCVIDCPAACAHQHELQSVACCSEFHTDACENPLVDKNSNQQSPRTLNAMGFSHSSV